MSMGASTSTSQQVEKTKKRDAIPTQLALPHHSLFVEQAPVQVVQTVIAEPAFQEDAADQVMISTIA